MSYGFLSMLTMNAKQLNDVVVSVVYLNMEWSSGN